MNKIKLPFGFETYLGNPDKRIQQAAVKRLGQIGGSDAIWVLMKFYENEPIKIHGGASLCSVEHSTREDVVVALGQISSEEAKE